MEVRKIRKIKNESIVAIPNILLDVMKWKVGDKISIEVKNNTIVLRKEK